MNESVLSGIIFAAQFSVATIIASVGVLILAITIIALNRLFHMFWIPTNFMQKVSNFLNDKSAVTKKLDPVLPGGGPGEQFDPNKHVYVVTAGKDGLMKGPTIYNSGSGGIYNNPPDFSNVMVTGTGGAGGNPQVTGVGGGGTKSKEKK